MAASGHYTVITGLEMIQTISGVPQILNSADAALSPTPALIGAPRPSKCFFSAILTNLVCATEDDATVRFFVIVPGPLDISDNSANAAPKWQPLFSFFPLNVNSADYSTVLPTMNVAQIPDPATRVMEVDLFLQGVATCSFMVGIDFKHSIF